MAHLRFETTTAVERDGKTMSIAVTGEVAQPPERVLAAVVDFLNRRGALFPAASAERTAVHAHAATNADVTEGTRAGPLAL